MYGLTDGEGRPGMGKPFFLKELSRTWRSSEKGTPWLPKWISVFVVAYALSPIDLVPDFIPVLGYLDYVIILPLGILLAIRLMPAQVLKESQVKAIKWEESRDKRPVSRFAAVVIVLVWLIAAAGVWWVYVL